MPVGGCRWGERDAESPEPCGTGYIRAFTLLPLFPLSCNQRPAICIQISSLHVQLCVTLCDLSTALSAVKFASTWSSSR